ncbi:Abhydrolase domain-containing protein 12B [Microtus ochrogaster]|uniref:Abhydrolase domain-containing protein 12B n=1 Tax=Microtus ochrogaster TaxID=79684 RepID=A0A8J6L2F1_MICOH|nr:Abhydrolase domain-containing protein 12B [Microtus ochrogaster]
MQVLSDGGFHVLSVDYRGFGDSTGTPTEEGLTTDAICVYEWAKARSGRTPVCLWGHSLGTGVATNAARALEAKGCPVDAIVLEAPFTNMWVASINYPLLKICQKLPRCLSTLMDAFKEDKIVFPNDENVKFLSSPLLILHGEDDRTVPLEYGKQVTREFRQFSIWLAFDQRFKVSDIIGDALHSQSPAPRSIQCQCPWLAA